MTQDEIIDAWNKQADYMNKWNYLGEDEKLEWAMKLEREACIRDVRMNIPRNKSPLEYQMAMRVIARIEARGQA